MAPLIALALTIHPPTAVPVGGPVGPMPWHLADVRLALTQPPPVTTLAVDLLVLDDPPGGHKLFIAPLATLLDGEHFYVGQLTQVVNAYRKDRRGGYWPDAYPGYWPHLPDGFLFSRWGDTDPDAVRQPHGGFFHAGAHEGPHVGVKVLHRWRKGRYTYRLLRTEQRFEADGKWQSWFAAFVYDHQSGSEVYVGSLRFPGLSHPLTHGLGWFVELYQARPPFEPVADRVPLVRVVVGNWRLNGSPPQVAGVSVIYPPGSPQVAEVKTLRRFLADGHGHPGPGWPTDAGAAGLLIHPKPVARTPGYQPLWTASHR
jgi:hypothetical protein